MDNAARKEELAQGLRTTQALIEGYAQQCGRPAPRLLPVTKFHPASDIALLSQLGVTDVGENREQEARDKAAQLPQVRFHMIGQVQTKKANHVASWASSVHSVDSTKLALALDRGVGLALERGQRDSALDIYVQVSADGDPARGGLVLPELDGAVELIEDLEHLNLCGLMVVPPIESRPAEVFQRIRSVVDELSARLGRGLEMSAGMSGDLREAIESGSDVVRVGTGIMGPRPLV